MKSKKAMRQMMAPAKMPKANGTTGPGNRPAGFPSPTKKKRK